MYIDYYYLSEEVLCLCYDSHLSPFKLQRYLNQSSRKELIQLWQRTKEVFESLSVIQGSSCCSKGHLKITCKRYNYHNLSVCILLYIYAMLIPFTKAHVHACIIKCNY